MNRLTLLWGILLLLPVLGIGEFVLANRLRRQTRLAGRLKAIRAVDNPMIGVATRKSSRTPTGLIVALGAGVIRSGFLPRKTLVGLEQTLISAGLRVPSHLPLFVGAKVLMLMVMPVLAFALLTYFDLSPLVRNVIIASAALMGLLAPDRWISRRYKKHLNAITQGLPDALDLMVICAQAGLGFEPAINRVAIEIRHAHPAISEEFGQTASELRVAANTRSALTNMGARTGLDSVKRMASTLAQTLQYGTPLSDALRVLSAEMREVMLIRFETRAARLPVLLTIPMILFILPCIFMIVGGPAVIQVMKSIHR